MPAGWVGGKRLETLHRVDEPATSFVRRDVGSCSLLQKRDRFARKPQQPRQVRRRLREGERRAERRHAASEDGGTCLQSGHWINLPYLL